MPEAVPASPDVAATFCATVVDEFARAGVRQVFIAPGSRSTPMALALASDQRLQIHVVHDERAGAFAALGVGLASGQPAVILTTSGTAAVELHPAVVEAHQARVPMLVLTADRPPELRDVGAPQTIDQQHLFGRSVRWFTDPGVPDWAARSTWRSLGSRAVLEATGAPAGPVHVNLPFREPLLGEMQPLPPGRRGTTPWHGRTSPSRSSTAEVTVDRSRRGLVVAGRGAASHAKAIKQTGWPVIADPRAGMPGVAHADALLRVSSLASTLAPEVVLRVGEPPASRVVNEWIDGCGARQVVVADGWHDPARAAADIGTSVRVTGTKPAPRQWSSTWTQVDGLAATAIDATLAETRSLTEPGIARAVIDSAPTGGHIVVASSMPVRDVEWYTPRRVGITVHANRGANGIDGVVSTALGVASTGVPTIALVGDLAFLHDSSALIALARRQVDLTVVVVDNDGGGIFSFLPQAASLDGDRFEQLFGTPHGTDCAALASAHGLRVTEATTPGAFAKALREVRDPRVVVAKSDRVRNVEVHRRLNAAVAEAVAEVAARG